MELIAIEDHYMSKSVNEKYMEVMTKIVSPAERARLEDLQGFLANSPISDLGEVRLWRWQRYSGTYLPRCAPGG